VRLSILHKNPKTPKGQEIILFSNFVSAQNTRRKPDDLFSVLFAIAPFQAFIFSGENTPTDHAPLSKGGESPK